MLMEILMIKACILQFYKIIDGIFFNNLESLHYYWSPYTIIVIHHLESVQKTKKPLKKLTFLYLQRSLS